MEAYYMLLGDYTVLFSACKEKKSHTHLDEIQSTLLPPEVAKKIKINKKGATFILSVISGNIFCYFVQKQT